ncbi:MAG TPA: hypothetical protein VET85_17225 [Stellaceae bacterium]|nr:hypothetical protein [Stellaceae bacterium]
MKRKEILLATAALMSLTACAGGYYDGQGTPSGLQTSQGVYANPTQTPPQYRVPQTNLVTSGIPGESGVSSVSSALSGGGGGGGGGGGSR